MSDLRKIHGTANGCSVCQRQLGSLKAFDAHQVHRDGVFIGQCIDPAELGLIQDSNGVWQTVAGAASRSRLAQMGHRERRTVS
jgi:hypothetical protein